MVKVRSARSGTEFLVDPGVIFWIREDKQHALMTGRNPSMAELLTRVEIGQGMPYLVLPELEKGQCGCWILRLPLFAVRSDR